MTNHSRMSFCEDISNTDREFFYNKKAPASRNKLLNSSLVEGSGTLGVLRRSFWNPTTSNSKNVFLNGKNSKVFGSQNSVHSSLNNGSGGRNSPDSGGDASARARFATV